MNMEADLGTLENSLAISNEDENMSIVLPRPSILKHM